MKAQWDPRSFGLAVRISLSLFLVLWLECEKTRFEGEERGQKEKIFLSGQKQTPLSHPSNVLVVPSMVRDFKCFLIDLKKKATVSLLSLLLFNHTASSLSKLWQVRR